MKYLILSMMFFVSSASALDLSISDEYAYVSVKVGKFFNNCENAEICYQADGDAPSYVELGYSWEFSRSNSITLSVIHRSNVFLGKPFGDAEDYEYNRDGIFFGYERKFRIVKR